MAERRMISKKIISSAKFLKMPHEAQNLYFYLILNADDDGIAEGFNVMRMLGTSEDSLKMLVAKGYVTVLNDDLVSHVTAWTEHNKIRADRKIDSMYKDLLLKIIPDIEILAPKQRKRNQMPANGQTSDGHGTDMGQQNDRIGKDRLGEVSIGKDSTDKPKRFSFKKALLDKGVHKDIVDDYLLVRKNKKSSNTKTAFTGLEKNINQSELSFNDAIKICAEKSWVGFNKDWLDSSIKKDNSTNYDLSQFGLGGQDAS